MKPSRLPTILLIVAAVAVAAIVGLVGRSLLMAPSGSPVAVVRDGGSTGQAAVGGPFTLVDQHGEPRTDQDFRGQLMLVFFGFTYCPDFCPMALDGISHALEELGPDADGVTPVFITVDPERDTPEVLRDYAAHFHPDLVALTGTPEQVAEAARVYRVYYQKSGEVDTDHYLVDHSTIVYLMGPDGRYLTHFNHSTTPEDMAATLRRHL